MVLVGGVAQPVTIGNPAMASTAWFFELPAQTAAGRSRWAPDPIQAVPWQFAGKFQRRVGPQGTGPTNTKPKGDIVVDPTTPGSSETAYRRTR